MRRTYLKAEDVTVEMVEKTIVLAAELVAEQGAKYLPIFERLEREMVLMYRNDLALRRAKQLAQTGDLSAYRTAAMQDPFTLYRTMEGGNSR